ncbi:TPA: nucleoside triphosphate pyrophosphohydrolase family protein [Pseudomonas aeruginosa]
MTIAKDSNADAAFSQMFPKGLDMCELDARMHQLFGNREGNKFSPSWADLQRYTDILKSEVEELEKGVNEQDFVEVLDGLGDILTVLHGLANLAGVDIREVWMRVFESNLTKFCRNAGEMEATLEKYKNQGVSVEAGGVFPFAYVTTSEAQVVNGRQVPKGKFLKCIRFTEPDFSDLLSSEYKGTRSLVGMLDSFDVPLQHRLRSMLTGAKPRQASERILLQLESQGMLSPVSQPSNAKPTPRVRDILR